MDISAEQTGADTGAAASMLSSPPKRKSGRRKTSHLKLVPETRTERERLREKCAQVAAGLDKSQPLAKDQMETIVRATLDELGMAEGYVGWMMVVLASEFWKDQVAAIPPERRLLLLPHCLKHAEGCPADYDEFGLDCEKCGACSIADFRGEAEKMGYKVLVAEGSPIVLKIIVSGHIDAIVGVACLNVLEKAIDKILLAGIPCMSVPLLSSDCRNTSVDEEWVDQMIRLRQETPQVQTRSYLHLMRAAKNIFETDQLNQLVPRLRKGPSLAEMNGQGVAGLDPVAATEAISQDFLAKGGKYSRPFITLAVHDSLTGGKGTLPDGAEHLAGLSDAVKRASLSIETFHKASLVHDDIEDDDAYRYGEQTMHRKYGTPTAINVGDYMIGLGYRLVSRESKALGADVVADIVDHLADAHLKLSEGQGAELFWRDACQKILKPLDALKIYALKTAPAFEVALYTGARLAGPAEKYEEPIRKFAQNLGVAFQILNDLKDWEGDYENKLSTGGDVFGGRPTVLWALALEALNEQDHSRLTSLVESGSASPETLSEVRRLYKSAGVFESANLLVDKYQQRAESIADDIEPDEFRRLLYYLVDTVLERTAEKAPEIFMPTMPVSLPITASP